MYLLLLDVVTIEPIAWKYQINCLSVFCLRAVVGCPAAQPTSQLWSAALRYSLPLSCVWLPCGSAYLSELWLAALRHSLPLRAVVGCPAAQPTSQSCGWLPCGTAYLSELWSAALRYSLPLSCVWLQSAMRDSLTP